MRMLVLRAALPCLVVLACACTTTTDRLRTRFGKEHQCALDEVQVTSGSATEYHASGCGQSADYVCPTFADMQSDARACEEPGPHNKPVGEPAKLPGAYPMSPAEAPGPTSH